MESARRTHILFDFFGTLVEYSASRTEQGYPRSYGLLRRMGATLDYPQFLAAWVQTCAEFDRRSDRDDREYSMSEVGTAFLAGVLRRTPAADEVDTFVAQYVGEWNTGVRYCAAVVDCVRELAREYRLAVVTNTHQVDLVPNHLAAMGLLPHIDAVVTSVEVGWRKPHPKIYAAALAALGIAAGVAVFVGDTYQADFVGPERAGLTALLIDPHRQGPVPEVRRLASILDLPGRLHTLTVPATSHATPDRT